MAESTMCCSYLTKKRHKLLAVCILLIIGMIIGGALGHCRDGRNFARGQMMGFERGGMMGNFGGQMMGGFGGERFGGENTHCNRQKDNNNSTGDIAKCQADTSVQKDVMQKVGALQDDYASLWRFIQRGDVASATSRIDTVVTELNQLKINLPKMTAVTK